jgi:hypothetical protein
MSKSVSFVNRSGIGKISVFGKSQCSATACLWEIEDILNLKRWKNSVGHLRNIKTAINYFTNVSHPNLPILLIGKMWLNIGIYQTLGFSILKMSPQCAAASHMIYEPIELNQPQLSWYQCDPTWTTCCNSADVITNGSSLSNSYQTTLKRFFHDAYTLHSTKKNQCIVWSTFSKSNASCKCMN